MQTDSSISSLVKRWGNSLSIALVEPGFEIFRTPDIDGVIGYRNESGYLIAFGDPICAPDDAFNLAKAFQNHLQEKGKQLIYIGTSAKFSNWAIQNVCTSLIEIGGEIILNPQFDLEKGSKGHLIRKKEKHAQHEGITVKEYLLPDVPLEQVLQQTADDWQKSRRRTSFSWFTSTFSLIVLTSVGFMLNEIMSLLGFWY